MDKFYSHMGAEDQLMDPLILIGDAVVPLVTKEIEDQNMPRRRYAIAALGNVGDHTAINSLNEILKDPSEKEYFRCDALEAIAMIDFEQAKEIVTSYTKQRLACMADLSNALRSKEAWWDYSHKDRSWFESSVGKHK